MTFGVTIYGLLSDTHAAKQRVFSVLATAFSVEYAQLNTLWSTLKNYPDFNHADVAMKQGGALIVHVYDSPADVRVNANCVFHAKIERDGAYT